jgi:hypothetical protein
MIFFFFSFFFLKRGTSSGWGSFRNDSLSSGSHQFQGLWQHLIAAVKVGSGGSVLVLSCAAATQPPAEVCVHVCLYVLFVVYE